MSYAVTLKMSVVNNECRAGFTYRLYRLKPRASSSKGGLQQTVVCVESIAGI